MIRTCIIFNHLLLKLFYLFLSIQISSSSTAARKEQTQISSSSHDRTRALALFLQRTIAKNPVDSSKRDFEGLLDIGWLGPIILFDIKYYFIREPEPPTDILSEIAAEKRKHRPAETVRHALSCMAAYRRAKILVNQQHGNIDHSTRKAALETINSVKSSKSHAGLMTFHALILTDKITPTLFPASATPSSTPSTTPKKTVALGKGGPADIENIKKERDGLLEAAAKLKCPIAAFTRARIHLTKEQTLPSAMWDDLLAAADLGYSPAQVLAAQIYQSLKTEPLQMRRLYELAAQQEEPEAYVQLALLELGWTPGSTMPYHKATTEQKQDAAVTADQDQNRSSSLEQQEQDSGESSARYAQAIQLLEKAVEKNYAPAYTLYALCHHYGIGVPQNAEKAKMLLQLATNQADPAAIVNYFATNNLQAIVRGSKDVLGTWLQRVEKATVNVNSSRIPTSNPEKLQEKLAEIKTQMQPSVGNKTK
eukprot:TRINITY_DN231_c0_g1_i4.p1 TRINITY_DN231_c0_g1~~TRINITY_DN231_c0_g1_i4.p1  ORF type:complete len:480 (-),score=96.09 TRINITY_DN231_c0_g1_i4:221-1660(-)